MTAADICSILSFHYSSSSGSCSISVMLSESEIFIHVFLKSAGDKSVIS